MEILHTRMSARLSSPLTRPSHCRLANGLGLHQRSGHLEDKLVDFHVCQLKHSTDTLVFLHEVEVQWANNLHGSDYIFHCHPFPMDLQSTRISASATMMCDAVSNSRTTRDDHSPHVVAEPGSGGW